MKKLINKIKNRNKRPVASRITNETMAEHREMILAGGRKFKYPIQYARHKLVINAVLISIVALVSLLILGWWQLYIVQNTSEFMGRVTRVIPVPVATVDGQPVLYGDYLKKYLSSKYYYEKNEQMNPKTDTAKRQLEYIKQQSMQSAIEDAYALKLSNDLGVSVSDSEVELFIVEDRKSVQGELSQTAYDTSISDVLGLSSSESRHFIKNGLMLRKVAYKLDKDASSAINITKEYLQKDLGQDFKKLANDISSKTSIKVIYGTSGWVPIYNRDGGLAAAAAKLKKSETSSIITPTFGVKGYYIVRLMDINEDEVNYEYINVPLTAFNKALDKITADGKVKKYISVSDYLKQ